MRSATGKRTEARRAAIRRILRREAIATQEDLGRRLAAEGIAVTQATLSRDLAELRAVRVSRPGGATAYELDDSIAAAGPERLRDVGPMVLSLAENGALAVLLTQPGSAPAVARAIDLARLPGVLGTLAGDDTVFLAAAKGCSTRGLLATLRTHLAKGLRP